MTNTELLLRLIKENGLKLSFIAQKLGISRTALYRKIKGLVPFTGPEINILCKLLDLKTWARIKPVFFADNVSKNDYSAS